MGSLAPGQAPEGHVTEARMLADGRVAVLTFDPETGGDEWSAITWSGGQVGDGEYDIWLIIMKVTEEELKTSVELVAKT